MSIYDLLEYIGYGILIVLVWRLWAYGAYWMGWISVEKRLPEPSTPVLVAVSGGHVSQGIYEKGLWIWRCSGLQINDDIPVTHWMPLPDPPKDAK